MENRDNNTASYVPRKSDQKNKIYNQEKSQKPYNDLREYLNQKRQTEESKSKGPPSEPKYSFLSDPLRDGNDGKYLQRSHVDQRGRGRGSTQRRGYYQGSNNYGFKTKKEEENKFHETNKKHGAENEENSQFRGQTHTRSLSYRANYQSRKYQGNRFESSQDTCTHLERNVQEENTSGYNRSRNYFPSRNMQRSTRRPAQYGGHQFKRNSKSLNPVNITVEYSVNLGTRKCTLDSKETKSDNEGNLNSVRMVPNAEAVCEEKRDDINEKKDNADESKVTEYRNSKKKVQDIDQTDDEDENKEIKKVIDQTISKDCHKINEEKEKIIRIKKKTTEC